MGGIFSRIRVPELWQVYWSMRECEAVAKEIYKSLPDTTHELLALQFKGKIITLSSDMDLASARKEDVHNNAVFLKPTVRKWVEKVLSRRHHPAPRHTRSRQPVDAQQSKPKEEGCRLGGCCQAEENDVSVEAVGETQPGQLVGRHPRAEVPA